MGFGRVVPGVFGVWTCACVSGRVCVCVLHDPSLVVFVFSVALYPGAPSGDASITID